MTATAAKQVTFIETSHGYIDTIVAALLRARQAAGFRCDPRQSGIARHDHQPILPVLETIPRFCQSLAMPNIVDAIVQSRVARAVVLVVVIIPISFYLGTSPVRRGILYYLEVFAPSVVLAIGVGLWTWSWKWFSGVLAICVVLTALTQSLVYLLW